MTKEEVMKLCEKMAYFYRMKANTHRFDEEGEKFRGKQEAFLEMKQLIDEEWKS